MAAPTNTRGAPQTWQAKAVIQQRRKDALELRLAGVDLVTIGKRLAADPRINSQGVGYPQGYGASLYERGADPPTNQTLMKLVSEDIRRAHDERRDLTSELVAEHRDSALLRLDRMIYALWEQAIHGDVAAIDRVIRIEERKAKMLGIDAAAKVEITGNVGIGGDPRERILELQRLWERRHVLGEGGEEALLAALAPVRDDVIDVDSVDAPA